MKRILISSLIMVVFFGLGCTSTAPPAEHFYLLHLPCQDKAKGFDSGSFSFDRCHVSAGALAQGSTIWARVSPIELEAWQQHKWALPIPAVVHAGVMNWARSAGHFSGVGKVGEDGHAWYCNMEVLNFEEVDQGGKWFACIRVKVSFFLKHNQNIINRWEGELERKIPARARNPQDLIYAFGHALEEILEITFKFSKFQKNRE